MRKKLLSILFCCLLLSACGDAASQTIQTIPSTTENLTDVSRVPLLEQGIAPEESANLRYIPNEAVESANAPEVRLLGNGLLLSDQTENELVLKHISLEDGALLAENAVPAGIGTKLYIGSGEIGLCDREWGRITILDEAFRILRTYEIPAEGDDWYLNSELDTLYIFFSQRGLVARSLENGEEMWLADNGFRVSGKAGGTGYVIFTYTDRTDWRTYTRCLDLSTASMETLSVGGIVGGIRQGETWLFQAGEPEGFHILVQGETAVSFSWTDSAVQLLSPRRHVLVTDPSGRSLTLYDTDGTFLSRCDLPRNSNAGVGTNFVWSGYWEGYFFTDFIGSSCRLMFWDVGADSEGEDLQMQPLEQFRPPQPVLEPQLYERAAQLSARFDVDIRIAEQCTLDYDIYDACVLEDAVFVRTALDILEESLGQYPEGFFRQLTYESVESIRIELVGTLTVKNDIDTHPESVYGFAQNRGNCHIIVLDGFMMRQKTVFHEVSHIIDKKLEWDALQREDALFSEEAWLALQPEGFRYAMSYTEIPQGLDVFMTSDYFVNEYALTFPTEDRAVLMASAMANYSWDFAPGSGRNAKLQFYAACIRDCFDTTDWPETTIWERALQ